MKRIVLIILALYLALTSSFACDFCNCYLGLNPHFKKNSIGIRYHFSDFKGSHLNDAELQSMGLSKNNFWEKRSIVELHGQWYPVQKLQLLFSVPYIINNEGITVHHDDNNTSARSWSVTHGSPADHATVRQSEQTTVKGMGDPLIIAHYQLFNKATKKKNKYSQRLLIGGGIKLPLGKSKLAAGKEAIERVHLPGSGSWDLIVSANYLGKLNRFGLNLNASYLFATPNNESFRFGNRYNVNAMLYYQAKIKAITIYPNTGAYLEIAGKDRDHNFFLNNSGGKIVYSHTGLDAYFKKFSINAAFQLPIVQLLNATQPKNQFRIITGISYALN